MDVGSYLFVDCNLNLNSDLLDNLNLKLILHLHFVMNLNSIEYSNLLFGMPLNLNVLL